MPLLKKNYLLWAGFAVCVGYIYFTYFKFFPVGFFNDDAKYIVLGQSLLQGTYQSSSLLNAPPETIHPPGYPFFLAPFIAIVQPHWVILKVISLILTALSCFWVWTLARWSRQPGLLIAAPVLFILNPVIAAYSGVVMSEPFYMCLQLLVFVSLWKVLQQRSTLYGWIFSLALTWAVLSRTAGLSLVLGITMGLAVHKPSRFALRWVVLPVLVCGLWTFRNHQVTQHLSGYIGYWSSQVANMSANPLALLDNALRVAYITFVSVFLGMIWPHTTLTIVGCLLVSAAVIGLAIQGMLHLVKSQAAPVGWVWSVGLYLGFYLLMQSGWTALSDRYMFLLFPFLLILVWAGLPSSKATWGLVVVLSLTYVYRHVRTFYRNPANPLITANQVPHVTFAWMKSHLPADAKVLYPATDRLYLYTGFQGKAGKMASDATDLRQLLLKDGIHYVVYQSIRALSVAGAEGPFNQSQVFELNRTWVANSPEQFTQIYLNESEKTAVYEIK